MVAPSSLSSYLSHEDHRTRGLPPLHHPSGLRYPTIDLAEEVVVGAGGWLAFCHPNSATVTLSLSLAFSLFSHLFSLLLILSLIFAWSPLYIFYPSDSPPLDFLGRRFLYREKIAGLVLLSVVVFFRTSVGSLIVLLLKFGVRIVCVHRAFKMLEDLFIDDVQEGVGKVAGGGLISFLGGDGAGSTVKV